MGIEIERKFLLRDASWRLGAVGIRYSQGYLAREVQTSIRIRIAGTKAFLTVKGKVTGISRSEFEYLIPINEAHEMLALCNTPLIEKTRYRIPHDRHLWEVDEFHGANNGLILAEVELQCPTEIISLPSWVGKEVTGDHRYYNSRLIADPFTSWSF